VEVFGKYLTFKTTLPLPDYNFDDNKVKVTITGKVLDENFARILIKKIEFIRRDHFIRQSSET
jgi:hypothetical protein